MSTPDMTGWRPGYETLIHDPNRDYKGPDPYEWQYGFSLLPRHPAVTGEKACWLCRTPETEKSYKFNVEKRLGDWIFMPDEQRRATDPDDVVNEVKEAQFCDMKCYMEGWPAVRRDYILAGSQRKAVKKPL